MRLTGSVKSPRFSAKVRGLSLSVGAPVRSLHGSMGSTSGRLPPQSNPEASAVFISSPVRLSRRIDFLESTSAQFVLLKHVEPGVFVLEKFTLSSVSRISQPPSAIHSGSSGALCVL